MNNLKDSKDSIEEQIQEIIDEVVNVQLSLHGGKCIADVL